MKGLRAHRITHDSIKASHLYVSLVQIATVAILLCNATVLMLTLLMLAARADAMQRLAQAL
jgi:hypothetical protein